MPRSGFGRPLSKEAQRLLAQLPATAVVSASRCPVAWPPQTSCGLCLFSGSRRWTRSMLRHGALWMVSLDTCVGSDHDLANPALRSLLEACVVERCFEVIWECSRMRYVL